MSPRPIEDVSGNNQEIVLTSPHSTTRNNDFTALVDTVAALVTQGIINNAHRTVMDPIDPYSNDPVPFLPNFRRILRNATGTDDLNSVTEVKLKVVTSDIGVQRLSVYTPNLKELTLDGSVISSLRDLGCGMNSLKVLKINGCKLKSLDGLNGVRNVEKLYAAHNKLTDLTPCTCLESLRHLDVRKNCLTDWNVISFLSLCENLKDLVLDENYDLSDDPKYRQETKRVVPQLISLDGVDFYEEDDVQISDHNADKAGVSLPSVTTPPPPAIDLSENTSCYTVKFGPKIVSPKSTRNSTHPDDSGSSNKLPKI